MILSRMKYAANDIHLFFIPILLIGLSYRYHIFLIALAMYLAYIYKRRIYRKVIFIITAIFAICYGALNFYTPKMPNVITGVITEASDNKYVLMTPTKGALFYSNEEYVPGDIVTIRGNSTEPRSESFAGGFSYKDYLKCKRVYGIYKSPKVEKKRRVILPTTLRHKYLMYLSKRMPKVAYSYLSTLIFGVNNLDTDLNDQIKEIGISHLFSISGFHVTVFYMILSYALSFFIKNERIRNNVIISFFVFYILFTNMQISILRSSLMIIMTILSKRYNRLYTPLDILSASGIIALSINPMYLYTNGFMLTYLISFFLMMVHIEGRGIKKAFYTGLLAYLSSMPLIININGEVNLMSLLLIPILSMVVGYMLIPYLLLSLFVPVITKINITYIFEALVKSSSKIDMLRLPFRYLNIYLIVAYYIIFISILIIRERRVLTLKWISVLLLYIMSLYSIRIMDMYLSVTFIDVGQGDSCLISLPNGKGCILIDTFGYNASYLKNRGIKDIDYMLITHSDDDHMGNIEEIKEKFNVGHLYTSAYDSLESAEGLRGGDSINIHGVRLDVLGPNIRLGNKNNNSLVVMLKYNGYRILFAGDMEREEENNLIDIYKQGLKADILKVGHHGSSTSSSKEFINLVSPRYSVISCGENNKYKFPHDEVLNRLSNSKVYRTDLSGNIRIIFKNDYFKVIPYKI